MRTIPTGASAGKSVIHWMGLDHCVFFVEIVTCSLTSVHEGQSLARVNKDV